MHSYDITDQLITIHGLYVLPQNEENIVPISPDSNSVEIIQQKKTTSFKKNVS